MSETIPPDYAIETKYVLKSYIDFSFSSLNDVSEYSLELLVTSWLKDLVKSNFSLDKAHFQWLKNSGLYEAIKNGSVVMDVAV